MKSRLRRLFNRHSGLVAALLLAATILSSMPAAARPVLPGSGESFTWGYKLRMRQEYMRNPFDLEDDYVDDLNYLRFRSRLWFKYSHSKKWELFADITNEFRLWFKPSEDFEINEFIFGNLYFRGNNILGSPISVVFGRQNMKYGDGFLMKDGGPLDDSRSFYVNALRVIMERDDRTLEVHALSDPMYDEYLPVINDQDQPLIEWDELGWGLYYMDNSMDPYTFEGYYFYKREKDPDNNTPETRLHTIGGRAYGEPLENLSFTAELAYQTGHRGNSKRSGVGANLFLTYDMPGKTKPAISSGVFYLSGDNLDTQKYETWDPLYSRWPKWSELYIYTLVNEVGYAYWQNMVTPFVTLTVGPYRKLKFIGSVYKMYANEPATCGISDCAIDLTGGKDRGLLWIFRLNWEITEQMHGHFMWERLNPGDFYKEYSEPADFLRWEVLFIF